MTKTNTRGVRGMVVHVAAGSCVSVILCPLLTALEAHSQVHLMLVPFDQPSEISRSQLQPARKTNILKNLKCFPKQQ